MTQVESVTKKSKLNLKIQHWRRWVEGELLKCFYLIVKLISV